MHHLHDNWCAKYDGSYSHVEGSFSWSHDLGGVKSKKIFMQRSYNFYDENYRILVIVWILPLYVISNIRLNINSILVEFFLHSSGHQNKIKIDCSLIVLLQNVALSTHVCSTLSYSSFVPSSARLHLFSISYFVTKTWRFHVLGARCWYNTTLLFNTSPCHVHKRCF